MGIWDEVIELENLRRAWRWVRSNPDAQFKAYFRELYTLYAIADDALLRDLQDRLRRRVYQPKPACKLFLPKTSGILRPYTLLTVEDQVVYQAAVNIIAERLFRRVRHRYNTEVFGHLYAGKTSQWFYRKWSDGYALFNGAIRKAFTDGYRVTASFDLTACYDSLDHGVLRHFLQDLRCDSECCKVLTEWLSVWTATDARYYHNHGIPQYIIGTVTYYEQPESQSPDCLAFPFVVFALFAVHIVEQVLPADRSGSIFHHEGHEEREGRRKRGRDRVLF